jgi:dipicolinate synthase subunit A
MEEGATFLPHPDSTVTHLLLPIPSFAPDGTIAGGGELTELLESLPRTVTVIGGNLDRPELAGYETWDLLADPRYLARNAGITAHCTLELALARLPVTLDKCPVLIIGWGRIGKCLAKLLGALGAEITVAARKESRRVMIDALGYGSCDISEIQEERYRLIINTVPAMVLPNAKGTGLKIDLASRQGITGRDVLWARGLPGRLAPESSGALIAQIIYERSKEK